VTNTVDPLGGSYFVESLTRKMRDDAQSYFARIDAAGGMIAAIESGYIRREIADAAFAYQRELDSRRKLIVGVNAFEEAEEKPLELLEIDETVEREQRAALQRIKTQRSAADVRRALDEVKRVAAAGQNVLPPLLEAAKSRATVGEIMYALADVLGRYRGPG
jgi:methylmalonyl-CoA mutase N-terminal domain/subunit